MKKDRLYKKYRRWVDFKKAEKYWNDLFLELKEDAQYNTIWRPCYINMFCFQTMGNLEFDFNVEVWNKALLLMRGFLKWN